MPKCLRAVDLFCGAGGLSLGMKRAGIKVVLANELSVDAEWTYRKNHLRSGLKKILGSVPMRPTEVGYEAESRHRLLVRERIQANRANRILNDPMRGGDIRTALSTKWLKEWVNLNGNPDIVAGGPPCQGFSSARGHLVNDERNQLLDEYLRVVSVLKPKAIIIENVPGMVSRHQAIVEKIGQSLINLGYEPRVAVVPAKWFGVPQSRKRILFVAIKRGLLNGPSLEVDGKDDNLLRALFPVACPKQRAVAMSSWEKAKSFEPTAYEILGDLSRCPPKYGNVPLSGTPYRPGRHFKNLHELVIEQRSTRSIYLTGKSAESQKDLLRYCRNHEKSDHSKAIIRKFISLQKIAARFPDRRCHSGFLREKLQSLYPRISGKSKKNSQRVLLTDQTPDITITSLPDDLLHCESPRILTVRECARLQSFPDWFEFVGVRTTCNSRRREGTFVPHYTQVANAIPPRFAHAVAQRLKDLLAYLESNDGKLDANDLPHGPYSVSELGEVGKTLLEINKGFRAEGSAEICREQYGVA